jgi:hypothetical protein
VRELPGGRRVVYSGRNYGHMERAYGRGYRMRTYYEHGRYRAVMYRPYNWHGRPYYVYAPHYYYRPAYYGWAYNPWARPVAYRWGWYGAPWYRSYGYYFAPQPVYPAANYWLGDYILAENLRMAYDARLTAALAPQFVLASATVPGDSQLTPEVKQMIADEVKQQLAAEKAAAGQASPVISRDTLPPALDPAHRIFVVAANLDVVTADGDECALSPGDVIKRTTDTPDGDDKVQVVVVAGKQGDCARGSQPAVAVADLEDMNNQFREQLDAGLKQLAENSGKNGLPSAPDTTTVAAKDVPTPQPDRDVATQLQGLQSEAEQAEQDVKKDSPGDTGGTS